MSTIRITDNTCNGCGSTLAERLKARPDEDASVRECPHCGSDKCSMCDMGDDVECGNCDTGDEE